MSIKNKRATMTSKQRRSSLFRRRIVIPLPDWSVFVVAGAIGFALLDKPMLVTNIVSLVLVIAAWVTVWSARREARALRHDVHEILNNINYADDEIIEETTAGADSTLEDYEPEKFHLKRVNGKRSTRVSEH